MEDFDFVEEGLEPARKVIDVLNQSLHHSSHVAKLSDLLFDKFASLHKLPKKYKKILHRASLLHDIGWAYGQRSHHKASCAMIVQFSKDKKFLPLLARGKDLDKEVSKKINKVLTKGVGKFSKEDVLITALVARYHRKSLPSEEHTLYASLSRKQKEIVCKLASFMRLADACDYSHGAKVKDFIVNIGEERVVLNLLSEEFFLTELMRVEKKKDLFEQTFNSQLICEVVDMQWKK